MKKKGKVLICILAILLIIIPVGCSKKSETIKIATKPMTELWERTCGILWRTGGRTTRGFGWESMI